MNLKQMIVSAVGWSVAFRLSVQFVTWAMTLVVITLPHAGRALPRTIG